jgi:hypothetical protein
MRAGLLIGIAVVGSFGAGWLARAVLIRPEERSVTASERQRDKPSNLLAAMSSLAAGSKPACPTQFKLDPEEHLALVNELAAAVRSSLDAGGKPEASHQETPRASAPKVPSPEAVAARQKVDALIGQAIAAHVWTDRDRMDLRPLRPQLADPEEVMRTLVQAMNDGRVSVQTQGPPF